MTTTTLAGVIMAATRPVRGGTLLRSVAHLGLLAAFPQASGSPGTIANRPDRLPTW